MVVGINKTLRIVNHELKSLYATLICVFSSCLFEFGLYISAHRIATTQQLATTGLYLYV